MPDPQRLLEGVVDTPRFDPAVWPGPGALRFGEPFTSPWVTQSPVLRVLVESLPVVPSSWVKEHGLGECLSRRRGWWIVGGLHWYVGRIGEVGFGGDLPVELREGSRLPAAPGSWQALCLRRPEVAWATWTVVDAFSLWKGGPRGDQLPRIHPDATGRTVGVFNGRTVAWGRTSPTVWVVRPGRVGPMACTPGATLQEELLIQSGKVLTVQSGRSPSSIAMRVVGEPPTALTPGQEQPPSTPDGDVWAGSQMLPALPIDRRSFRTASRQRHTVSVSVSGTLGLEIAHAKRWLQADYTLGTVALCGPPPIRWLRNLEHRRAEGYLDEHYHLKRAGWWRLAHEAGQGVGEVERYRARRLARVTKRTHLSRVQKLVLGYMAQGGIPLGVEISLTAQVLATWLGMGRPDALVWMEKSNTLVWIEVETRPLHRARSHRRNKFAMLQGVLPGLAGALRCNVELCLQEVGQLHRQTWKGDLARQAWAAGVKLRPEDIPPPDDGWVTGDED